MTRKVTHGAAAIKLGLADELRLGNLEGRRDWGYSADYVRAMWLMLRQEEPSDFVVASGVAHTVQELVACAFEHVGLDWRDHVRVDDSLVRGRAELHHLVGDPRKAREVLGWQPAVAFEDLVRLMVDEDVRRLRGRKAS